MLSPILFSLLKKEKLLSVAENTSTYPLTIKSPLFVSEIDLIFLSKELEFGISGLGDYGSVMILSPHKTAIVKYDVKNIFRELDNLVSTNGVLNGTKNKKSKSKGSKFKYET